MAMIRAANMIRRIYNQSTASVGYLVKYNASARGSLSAAGPAQCQLTSRKQYVSNAFLDY